MKTIQQNYLVLGLLVITLFLSSCGAEEQGATNSKTNIASDKKKMQSVEVIKPKQRSFIAEVLISGTAKPNQKIIVYAMVSGYIKKINKDIGDLIRKGEIIAELENPEIIGRYNEKKAQLEARKTNFERLKSIHEKTPALTPLQLVENAEAEYLSAKAIVNVLKNRINFLQIRAPFTGRITKRMVDHGALVQSGLTEDNPQGIVEIQEFNPIRLTIPLPESDIAAIDKGMAVTVTFPELTGESFQAVVSRTAGALDPASKTMQVEVDIKNPNGFIKPGMYAKANMQISNRKGVLSLPVTAQWIYQNQPFVLIVNKDKVERVPLRKGLSNKDYFEVLNPEITENSLVIIQGKGLVQPGQIVKPVIKSE